MDSEDWIRLTVEVALDIPLERSALPNTSEVRKARGELVTAIADIRARKLTPDIPTEWPTFRVPG